MRGSFQTDLVALLDKMEFIGTYTGRGLEKLLELALSLAEPKKKKNVFKHRRGRGQKGEGSSNEKSRKEGLKKISKTLDIRNLLV